MDNNFILQLIARLDASKTPDDLKKIEQQLNNKGISLRTTLNTATSKQELQNYVGELQKVLSGMGIEIDGKKLMSGFNASIKENKALFNDLINTAKQLNGLQTKQLKITPESNPEQWKTLSAQIDEVSSKYDKLWSEFWSKPQNLSFFKMEDLNQLKELGYTLDETKSKLKDTLSGQAGKIGLNIDTGTYQSQVDSLVAKTQKWTDANGNARISTTDLRAALDNLNSAYTTLSTAGGNTEANQRALIEAEKQLGIQIQDVTNKVTTMNSQLATDKSVQSLLQRYQDFYNKNTAAHRKWGAELKAGIAELSSGMPVSLQRAQQLEQGILRIGNAAAQAGKLGLSWFDKLKQGMSKFSYWTSSTFIIMKTVQEVREAISFAKEMDSALANINYTMGVTQSELTNIGNSSIQMAKDLKTSASDVLGAVTLYANAKETADSILKKSETAIMLGNVTGMSGQESAKALQSVMNQFDLTQDDLTYISDTIQKVSQNMAYDFSKTVAA